MSGRQQATACAADVHHGVVGAGVQAVMQEICGTVSQQGVTLHFTEPDSTAELASLDWLVGLRIHRSC